MKPPTVHKYRGDDPTATTTACGLWIGMTIRLRRVDADARKVTCGNCAKVRTVKP